jgi:hypothetical protein
VELEGSQREDDEGGAAWCDMRRTKAGSHGSLRITKTGSRGCTLGIMGHASLIVPHRGSASLAIRPHEGAWVEEDLAVLSIGRQLSSFVGARRAKSRGSPPRKKFFVSRMQITGSYSLTYFKIGSTFLQ